tara:strand:+ start:93 stop:929 length:837 start_codon:yes stop_codon:yes gene_type:complete
MEHKYSPSAHSQYAKQDDTPAFYDSDMKGADDHLVQIPRGAKLYFASITEYALAKDAANNTFAVYTLNVRSDASTPSSWNVYRRYQEFRDLSDALRHAGIRTPVLPPKKLIGTLDAGFLEQRQVELEAWLHQLIEYYNLDDSASKDPMRDDSYRKFLTQMANQPPFPMERRGEKARPKNDGESKYNEEANKKICIDDFKLVKVIGKGSFGKVTLVQHKESGDHFAMKVLKKDNVVKRKQVEHTRTERRVLGGVNHPFIVRLHYAFQTEAKVSERSEEP